jgi:hypothetical protein
MRLKPPWQGLTLNLMTRWVTFKAASASAGNCSTLDQNLSAAEGWEAKAHFLHISDACFLY